MSAREHKQLFVEFSKSKDIAIRNKLIEIYLYLVKRTAQSMAPAYRKYIQVDDLVSYGIIGLIDAIDKYNPAMDTNFEIYAKVRIRGSILDALRKSDWASNYMRQKIKAVENAMTELSTVNGVAPSEKEIAEYLKMDITQVQNALDESYTFNMVYLDDLMSDASGKNAAATARDEENIPDSRYEEKELVYILSQCIDTLSDKEKLILKLYYEDELTLKEIGLVVGLTESRISQIHSKILITLRKRFEELDYK